MANFNIDYLIVAGGGAGGRDGGRGGGGGAGGLLTSIGQTPLTFSAGTQYTLTVGQGGLGSASVINNGDDSELNGSDITLITATGGGRGGGGPNTGGLNRSGSAGGSGGGAIAYYSGGNPGTGNTPATTPSQGNNGGDALSTNQYGAGGGGGAGAAGSNGSGNNGGTGGVGITNSITVASGTGPYYAGGGAGGGTGGNVSGGSGGGGSFNNSTGIGSSGTNGLGGGGAGGGMAGVPASGGSGVIILRYTTSDIDSYTTTGAAPTETIVGTDTVLSFTTVGTGTITFTTPIPPFNLTKVTTPVTDFNKINTEEGLKIPSGTSSNQPTGVEGMVRNDTTQSSKGSSSAITYYNGTNWRYFENELNTSFNTVLYTGTSSTNAITSVGFQPDLIWVKSRSGAFNNMLTDSINGGGNFLIANTTATLNSNSSAPTIDQSGFTLGAGNSNWNNSSYTYVAWCFKAGGLTNKAADFNGSSSTVSLPGTPLNSLTSITYSAWVYYRGTGSGQSYGHIISGGSTSNQSAGKGLGIAVRNSDDLLYIWKTNGSVFSTTTLPENEWSHVALTNNAGAAKLYLNGAEVFTTTLDALNFDSSGNIIDIGEYFYNGSHHFYGSISQVRIFNNALSSSEITQLYNETKVDNSVLNFPSGSGCVAAYPLGENANGVDGIYNGTASNVTFDKPGYLTRNTEGTIESTVSANNDLGFSIVSYTGNGTAGSTVGHGLDSTPEMVIVKSLTSTANNSWSVYQADVGNNGSLTLELANTPYYNIGYWNNTSPTSSVFTLGYYEVSNRNNANYIAYCFTSKPNYSKVGSYLGNGNTTGPLLL